MANEFLKRRVAEIRQATEAIRARTVCLEGEYPDLPPPGEGCPACHSDHEECDRSCESCDDERRFAHYHYRCTACGHEWFPREEGCAACAAWEAQADDAANIGRAYLATLREFAPNASWSECPTEVFVDVQNERDAAVSSAENAIACTAERQAEMDSVAFALGLTEPLVTVSFVLEAVEKLRERLAAAEEGSDLYDAIAELVDDQDYDGRTTVDCVQWLHDEVARLTREREAAVRFGSCHKCVDAIMEQVTEAELAVGVGAFAGGADGRIWRITGCTHGEGCGPRNCPIVEDEKGADDE